MAAESVRGAVPVEGAEPPQHPPRPHDTAAAAAAAAPTAAATVTYTHPHAHTHSLRHAHTRSQSHVQFPPHTHAQRQQAPRTLAHTRSHSHTCFNSQAHIPSHKFSRRLTHSLSAMTKGDKSIRSSLVKLTRPSDPLLSQKPPQEDMSQRLSFCSKLCFAIGGAPKEVAASATAFFLQIYLLDVAQITPMQASMVLFIGKVWGAITDPLVGFFITKSKWTKIGRLMPWMVGCTPFVVVSYFYLWYVPSFTHGRFIWYLGFYCLYQTLITVSIQHAWAHHNPPFQNKSTGQVCYFFFKKIAQCIVRLLCVFLSSNDSGSALLPSPPSPSPPMQKEVYMIAAGVVAAVFLVCTVVMFLGVRERDGECLRGCEEQLPFHKGFILVMKHGPYLTLTAAFLFITVAIQLVQSNFVLFCTYAVDLKDHFQNIVLTILVSAVVSIPMWQWFLQRFGKKTAAFCGISWIMPFTLMLVFIPYVAVAYVVAVASGLSVAASLLLPWSMLPDVVDNFRLANPTSKGHEAIFYSFYVFFTKFASGISLGVSTLCLQFAEYDTSSCKQKPAVAYTLKLLIGVAPVAFIITGLIILIFYPISEEVRLRNRTSLEELRKQGLMSKTMENSSSV
ncbi:major facilitator superfamily domain-containing protein 2B [Gadus macrocephalus]|uniref:major facilitator superfamily domain-containing protein 2B n=1 Tax=Gadus macrocephalus TaxID=80720 RepID=UPI0028CB3AB0|nr:major facilitator superfamily domain-containing protein 2B [Gadus macrocephalus]